MTEANSWRPQIMEWLPLTDLDLSKLGMTAVLEAQAKSMATVALKNLERKSHAEWIRLEGMQFVQICSRLMTASADLDQELHDLVKQLDEARDQGHELRHIVVHASWGLDADSQPTSYDYRRTQKLDRSNIDQAMEACLKLRTLAHRLLMRIGHLIGEGVLHEGSDTAASMTINISGGRKVRL
ncbi:hypothetical protein [Sphingomonas sp. Ant20]|uniref:hypothetical protein n=1 Tax=Sphingomonas sp. Ant20 TaxID=104605 RepID=UPI000FE13CE4|nr:hypothetical protein [Sphingomonas sp. Ant20]